MKYILQFLIKRSAAKDQHPAARSLKPKRKLNPLVHHSKHEHSTSLPGRSAGLRRWSSPSADVRRKGLKATQRYFPAALRLFFISK